MMRRHKKQKSAQKLSYYGYQRLRAVRVGPNAFFVSALCTNIPPWSNEIRLSQKATKFVCYTYNTQNNTSNSKI